VEAEFIVRNTPIRYKASITYSPTELNRDEITNLEESWNFEKVDQKQKKWLSTPELFIAGQPIKRRGHERFYYAPSYSALRHHELAHGMVLWKTHKRQPASDAVIKAFEAIQRFRV